MLSPVAWLFLYYLKHQDPKSFIRFYNEFHESDHPRDEDGQFSKKEEGSQDPSVNDDLETSQILGEEFKDFKGKDAINKLLKEKCGHVKDAFKRDDIGGIALVWGNSKFGLQHIIERRIKTGQNLNYILDNLTDIIETGNLKFDDKLQRFEIYKNNRKIVIQPKIYDKKFQFILTAFELI